MGNDRSSPISLELSTSNISTHSQTVCCTTKTVPIEEGWPCRLPLAHCTMQHTDWWSNISQALFYASVDCFCTYVRRVVHNKLKLWIKQTVSVYIIIPEVCIKQTVSVYIIIPEVCIRNYNSLGLNCMPESVLTFFLREWSHWYMVNHQRLQIQSKPLKMDRQLKTMSLYKKNNLVHALYSRSFITYTHNYTAQSSDLIYCICSIRGRSCTNSSFDSSISACGSQNNTSSVRWRSQY